MKFVPKPMPGCAETWFWKPAFAENVTSGNWLVITVPFARPSNVISAAKAGAGTIAIVAKVTTSRARDCTLMKSDARSVT